MVLRVETAPSSDRLRFANGYVVTEASCHDRIAAETVMTQIPHPYNLEDKGFISRDLPKRLYDEC